MIINGGIKTLEEAKAHLAQGVDGVMIGRAAYQNPYMLAQADAMLFGEEAAPPSRRDVVESLVPYLEARLADGTPLKSITRHILGLYNGLPGAKHWRRMLSEEAHREVAGPEVVLAAMEQVERLVAERAAA